MRPSLDQKSELLRVLQTDEGISKHFELDGDNGWDFVRWKRKNVKIVYPLVVNIAV